MIPHPCPSCGFYFQLTTDHVVPAWLRQQIQHFGLTHKEVCVHAGFTDIHLERKVCSACNMAKGGTIQYKDPIVRQYVRALINLIDKKMRGTSEGKLKVLCKCGDHATQELVASIVATHNGVIPL